MAVGAAVDVKDGGPGPSLPHDTKDDVKDLEAAIPETIELTTTKATTHEKPTSAHAVTQPPPDGPRPRRRGPNWVYAHFLEREFIVASLGWVYCLYYYPNIFVKCLCVIFYAPSVILVLLNTIARLTLWHRGIPAGSLSWDN